MFNALQHSPDAEVTTPSVAIREAAQGYSVRETADRFWRERLAENVLRVAGVFILLAGQIHWFRPGLLIAAGDMLNRASLSVLFMATGISVYLFASRGFRREFAVDLAARRIRHGRLNSRDRCLIAHHVPLAAVESVYVRRGPTPETVAELRMRLKGAVTGTSLLRGTQAEVEAVHLRICSDVRQTLDCGPKRVVPRRAARSSRRPPAESGAEESSAARRA